VMGHVAVWHRPSENNFATVLDSSAPEVVSLCGVRCEVEVRLHKVMEEPECHSRSCR